MPPQSCQAAWRSPHARTRQERARAPPPSSSPTLVVEVCASSDRSALCAGPLLQYGHIGFDRLPVGPAGPEHPSSHR
eukprot:7798908-Alexandrium_andersonii.AAC.1